MFRRERHRRLLELLAAFDSGVLSRCRFLFGGGTRIVLELDEYRESLDIDFLCSDAQGYAELRFQASSRGYDSLFKADARPGLHLPREMRIDQYGIRFPVEIEGGLIRVELIREARIGLDAGVRPDWSPVDCLALGDCFAEKLLANSDRWADRQVFSRDLIDLGALRGKVGPIPSATWAKVEPAYKAATRDDLRKALTAFLGDAAYQRRCFEGLRIDGPDEILRGMETLLQDLGGPPAQRQ
ncbi:MAG: nucleotidyl transferase AbiEii/AbiGii toxin family protein [Thermoanaerobaculia bacterium]